MSMARLGAGLLGLFVLTLPATAAEPQSAAASETTYQKLVRPFLQNHCVDCHNDVVAESDLRLDNITADFGTRETARHWIEVRGRINLGEMPPEGEPRPQPEQVAAVSRWIAQGLRQAELAALSRGGQTPLRRMNRAEYTNTVRDLLHLRFLPGQSPADLLPPDGTAEGFDKVGVALMLDPSLMQKYYDVASRIADRAIVDGPPEFPTEVMRMEFEEIAQNRAINYLCDRGGFQCRENDVILMEGSTRSFGRLFYPGQKKTIPTDGFYRVTVRAGADPGARGEPVIMRLQQNHPDKSQEVIMELAVEAPLDKPRVYSVVVPRDTLGGEWQVHLVNGTSFRKVNHAYWDLNRVIRDAGQAKDFKKALQLTARRKLEGGHDGGARVPETVDTSDLPKLLLDYIEIEGPLYEQWPPKSHEALFFRESDAEPTAEYIRAMFTRFLPRAFRRPVQPGEVEPFVKLVQQELDSGQTFPDAMRVGLTAVLCTPKFLYLAEPSPGPAQPLNDYEIANRLSYFLWSSMPDAELFRLAREQKLRDPDVIAQQVDRMLADPRAEGLVDGFARQWLHVDTFRNFRPDARQYQDYDDALGEAMEGETLAFFREILKHDLSVLNFIDSDFTMVNQRLARHYGIDGIEGDEFRRVPLPAEAQRGGLLMQAGVLMAGSDGDRTKPVSRGVYVREVLFNDPPDPPPPNVGEIEPNIEGKNLTVRERLIQHQQIQSCAACHRTIDPYGLALENYDVIGRWRDRQNGEGFNPRRAPEIDASGTLPNGKSFATPAEFKALLLGQAHRFRRGLTEKLMIYALGRPLEPSDDPTVERLSTRLPQQGDTLRALIKGIATSRTFLTK